MANDSGSLSGLHEQIQKLNKELFDEDGKFGRMKVDVDTIKADLKWHDKQIGELEDDIKTILDNTTWLKRAILTAIIGAVTTGIIGGAIALIWTTVGK